MIKITCTIITLNEGDRIERTLKSLTGVVDEIIVVDSGSSDKTEEICNRYNTNFIHNDWPGYGPQKRFAEDQATHNWILNLDADEVLTPKLQKEIIDFKQSKDNLFSGFKFKIISVYPHHDKTRFLAEFYNIIRLYNLNHIRYRDSLVHDVVDPNNHKIGQLNGECFHYSFRSLDHIKEKLESYTSLQAKEIKKPIWSILLRLPFEYPSAFIRFYLLRRHITGGLFGLQMSHIMAKSKVNRLLKILKRQLHRHQ